MIKFRSPASVSVGVVVRIGATVATGAMTENSFSGDFIGDPFVAVVAFNF